MGRNDFFKLKLCMQSLENTGINSLVTNWDVLFSPPTVPRIPAGFYFRLNKNNFKPEPAGDGN